jgi:hypothetical protein
MSLFTPEEREEIAERVSRPLGNDDRIEGVVIVGSSRAYATAGPTSKSSSPTTKYCWRLLPTGSGICTNCYPSYTTSRRRSETLSLRGFLLENLLELDLAFVQTKRVSIWGPARVVFDRSGRVTDAADAPAEGGLHTSDLAGEAGFAWHDVLHACTAVRRGRLWQGLWYMERIRNRTLKLAQERRGFYADFFDYVDDLPIEELTLLEDTLGVSLSQESLLGAVEVATRAFLAELRHGEPALVTRLEGPLLEFVRLRQPETD